MKALAIALLFLLTAFQPLSAQWVSQPSGVTTFLMGVYFVNSSTGWAAGDNGVVLATTNGGTNWFNQASGTTNNLTDVQFLNTSTGWIVGHEKVLYTTDGGTNWISASSEQYNHARSQFVNSQTGYTIVGDGYITKTTNAGVNWAEYSTGTSTILLDLFFIDETTGWVCALDGKVRKTTNSGINWFDQNIGAGPHITSISFINSNTGWVSGAGGKLYKTTNGGTNWTSITTGHSHFISRILFQDINTGWMSTDNGRIYVTSNSGTNWTQQITGFSSASVQDLHFINKTTGWACTGDGKILATSTGGFAVGQVSLSSPANGATGVSTTASLQWASVANSSGYHIQVSTDSNFTTTVVNDTTLAGTSYTPAGGILSTNTKYYWRVRAKHNSGAGFYSDTRNFTTALPAPSTPNLISPANNSIGQSVNPPLDWDSAGSITTFRAQVSTDSLFASTNFDTTISHSNITVPNGKLFANTKYYWRVMATGSGGSSNWSAVWNFRTMVTGITGNGTGIPAEYKLYNNYPNPFNPATKISYDLPEGSNVKLAVYDILGKEVATLINEFKTAGNYTIQFNAEGLTSGVYFYSIEAQGFKDIKRMVIVK